jgi:hypothetical protein
MHFGILIYSSFAFFHMEIQAMRGKIRKKISRLPKCFQGCNLSAAAAIFFSARTSGSTTPASASPLLRKASGTAPLARPRWPGKKEESEESKGVTCDRFLKQNYGKAVPAKSGTEVRFTI